MTNSLGYSGTPISHYVNGVPYDFNGSPIIVITNGPEKPVINTGVLDKLPPVDKPIFLDPSIFNKEVTSVSDLKKVIVALESAIKHLTSLLPSDINKFVSSVKTLLGEVRGNSRFTVLVNELDTALSRLEKSIEDVNSGTVVVDERRHNVETMLNQFTDKFKYNKFLDKSNQLGDFSYFEGAFIIGLASRPDTRWSITSWKEMVVLPNKELFDAQNELITKYNHLLHEYEIVSKKVDILSVEKSRLESGTSLTAPEKPDLIEPSNNGNPDTLLGKAELLIPVLPPPDIHIPEIPTIQALDLENIKTIELELVDFKPSDIDPVEIKPIEIPPVDIKPWPSSALDSEVTDPVYTPEMVKKAESSMLAAGALVMGVAPQGMQLSVAGRGAWIPVAEIAGNIATRILSAVKSLMAVNPITLSASVTVAGLWPKEAGKDSDKVPGRDVEALFAVNARLLAEDIQMSEFSRMEHIPVRGAIVMDNGRPVIRFFNTGATGRFPFVPVLKAERDELTGLDKIIVPGINGGPSRTILINPVPVPSVPTDTGNTSPVPVTPVHTGTEVKPVDNIGVTISPVPEDIVLNDFIYWQPGEHGTVYEPIYVMLSGIYGETNAKGKYSHRPYNTDKAGGPIQNLDWKNTEIDRVGVDKVKLHTGRFEESDANKVMIDRLEKILKGELQVTDTDKRFYTHEIRELERYRNLGVKDGTIPDNAGEVWNNTHTATLEDYKLSNDETLLYTPEALKAAEEQELRMLK
ncbi:S-type pyocin domain-containing protein [Escherichia coli]|uniref:S-type pyocin domain-containing protein n=1 Tax=Escherichia coli TaxID=562 RepID=UPI001F2D0CE3|nr:S-type pyocin domain-containing protein [Escherichia coli]MCF4112630.1 S-type pyocin domain-containing protein [Escherichia coli]